ncbi:CBS domain-containing protein [Paenibacillus nasutitermitis]|nr:CBS domain-containing protein [Paenibacillus nasutitermitis]
MTRDCVTIMVDASLHQAALLMRDHNIGFLPVVGEGRELAGVITDRDLVIRGYADHQLESVTVGEIVSRNITSIRPSTTVEEAARIMAKEQIRRLPVVDKGRLLGIVALGDIAIRKVLAHEAGETLGRISLPAEA